MLDALLIEIFNLKVNLLNLLNQNFEFLKIKIIASAVLTQQEVFDDLAICLHQP